MKQRAKAFLTVLIIMGLLFNVFALAVEFDHTEAEFYSDIGGGAIVFSQDLICDSVETPVENQVRFDNLTYGSYNWGDIGFRCPTTSTGMTIDSINATHIVITTSQLSNTTYEVWLPFQYEPTITGASGSYWVNSTMYYYMLANGQIVLDWTGTPTPPPDTVYLALSDSYPSTNADGAYNIRDEHPADEAEVSAVGQTFNISSNAYLYAAKFYLKKSNNPTSNLTASVYSVTGTYGTNSRPTGAALATSEPYLSSLLSSTYQLITFNFTGANRIQFTPGNLYAISVEASSTGVSAANAVLVAKDGSSPSHSGNLFYYYDGSWSGIAGSDTVFYLYTGGVAPVINSTSLDEVISVDQGGWINATISDSNGLSDLTSLTLTINTTGDANTAVYRWTQSTGNFTEVSDTDSIIDFNASLCSATQIGYLSYELSFWLNFTAGQGGAATAYFTLLDDEGLNDTDTATFTFTYFDWVTAVYDFINSAFGMFGVGDFMTTFTTYITAAVVYFDFAITSIIDLLDLQFTIVLNVFPWFLRWMLRIVNRLVAMGSILVSILNGTHSIMTGLGSIWDMIELDMWVPLIVLFGIIMWIESIPRRAKYIGGGGLSGEITVALNDIQTVINIIGYFMNLFMTVLNIVIDGVFRLFSAIT